ncbi:PREDICTED: MAPK/MAK/MRK overlapping kinase [Ficedula albicollis]|uniref:MAPK/MAK/MRK overlapping kinase n=1 Tax=Ficedula albicollis TaxID=59894 RepID=UPI0007AD9475|nr:PREDICTED: MAPK/MAK/MRK overlapping kinase [Ficedula albicollis]
MISDENPGSLSLVCEFMPMNIYELMKGRRKPLPGKKKSGTTCTRVFPRQKQNCLGQQLTAAEGEEAVAQTQLCLQQSPGRQQAARAAASTQRSSSTAAGSPPGRGWPLQSSGSSGESRSRKPGLSFLDFPIPHFHICSCSLTMMSEKQKAIQSSLKHFHLPAIEGTEVRKSLAMQ